MALGGTHVQEPQRGHRGRVGGRVHVNGERVKPSKVIRTGDTIDVTIRTLRRTLVVTRVAERRGPASDALTMYAETPESLIASERQAADVGFPVRLEPTSAHAQQSRHGGDSTHYAGDYGHTLSAAHSS